MFIPWDYAQKQAATREALRDGNSCTPSITIVAAENFESHMVEYIKGQVLMRIFVSER
jgi:DNA polymerase epsilon subunit 1